MHAELEDQFAHRSSWMGGVAPELVAWRAGRLDPASSEGRSASPHSAPGTSTRRIVRTDARLRPGFDGAPIWAMIHYQIRFTTQWKWLTVKTLATIVLDPATPDRTRDILAALPRVAVKRGKRQAITANGTTHPLVVLQGIRPHAHVTAPLLGDITKPDRVPIVVAERLTRSVRAALEDAGCSYADGTGAVHLELPGFLLHVEAPRARLKGTLPPPRGIGAVGVRVVQTLLLQPEREWGVVDLADASGASTGEAHKVLQRLESEGLVRVAGTGRARHRRVVQPADLLDWLARVPTARRIHARLNGYAYAPDPDALITRLSYKAHQSGITWALTGAAGARVMGVSAVTALPIAMVRVPTKPGLLEAAEALGVEPVDSGSNVLLVADVGAVGTHAVIRNGPVAVAPGVRVWLDMLSETRGEDAASLFREAALDF